MIFQLRRKDQFLIALILEGVTKLYIYSITYFSAKLKFKGYNISSNIKKKVNTLLIVEGTLVATSPT